MNSIWDDHFSSEDEIVIQQRVHLERLITTGEYAEVYRYVKTIFPDRTEFNCVMNVARKWWAERQ